MPTHFHGKCWQARKGEDVKIFAISDLHLPGGVQKPMDIFGTHWCNHFERIAADWQERVGQGDAVLLPGDFCWAMQLEDALVDLRRVAALPGQAVLLRGNHDYWWSAISRVRAALPEGMAALQNDALDVGTAIVCGTRGWLCPGDVSLCADDLRVYRREVQRLALSLQDAKAKQARAHAQGRDLPLVAMMHFPPFASPETPSGFTDLLEVHGVSLCVYGHLHGPGIGGAFQGMLRGIAYRLVSCDALGFRLLELPTPERSAT